MVGPRTVIRGVVILNVIMAISSLTMDEEATRHALEAAVSRSGSEIALVLRGLHQADKQQELLHFKAGDDAATLYYDKENNKVHLESLHGGHLRSVSWSVSGDPTTLTLVIHQNKVKLNFSCKTLHWHQMSRKHNLSSLLANPNMRLYHDENLAVEVYGNERAAFESLGCDSDNIIIPSSLITTDAEKSDVIEVRDFIKRETMSKRQEEKMQGDDYRNNYIDSNGILPQQTTQRGDIPSNGIESCDDEVIRQLTLLRQIIENLRREIADQKGIIENLHGQLRQCCQRIPAPPPVERCSSTSCYPGY